MESGQSPGQLAPDSRGFGGDDIHEVTSNLSHSVILLLLIVSKNEFLIFSDQLF